MRYIVSAAAFIVTVSIAFTTIANMTESTADQLQNAHDSRTEAIEAVFNH